MELENSEEKALCILVNKLLQANLFLNNMNKELSIDVLKFIGNILLEIFRKWQKI